MMKDPLKKIFLTGFMGVGKTYWGKYLSSELDMGFLDLDALIEEKEGLAIASIFRTKGEYAFRRLERKWLEHSILHSKARIVSLGGGTLINKDNLKLIKQSGYLIWLKKDSLLITEERSELNTRPLYDPQKLDELYSEREKSYLLADYRVDLDQYKEEEIIKQDLLKYIRRSLNL